MCLNLVLIIAGNEFVFKNPFPHRHPLSHASSGNFAPKILPFQLNSGAQFCVLEISWFRPCFLHARDNVKKCVKKGVINRKAREIRHRKSKIHFFNTVGGHDSTSTGNLKLQLSHLFCGILRPASLMGVPT